MWGFTLLKRDSAGIELRSLLSIRGMLSKDTVSNPGLVAMHLLQWARL